MGRLKLFQGLLVMARGAGLTLAAQEHILAGNPITSLEGLVFFGVADVARIVTDLRRSGWTITAARVPYARVLVRINRHATLTLPPNLPIREILMTEYRLQK